ncbi:ATP-binding protein [Kineococcus sp. TRM81007]|uniref:AAA family ATPase n=1 Tax=Kineococcus sp. TRM81007 TaxID=2925831 RepID=UPI001F585B69|nr:ATP-binding protein [Kineococcus sp. TRM81007]MCI2237987.1 ATP-binding protein [Kineococcus sp. TRM81007]
MVGLPGAGKTVRARQLEQQQQALRLTPDEWMIPLFGEPDAGGKRDVLEGRLLWTALQVAGGGLDVVVDFGLWGRDERSALRWLFTAAGADCRIEYLPLDVETQLTRIRQRFARTPEQTFEISAEDLQGWRESFQEPTADELRGDPVPPPPTGYATWSAWAATRWPSLPDSHGHPASHP